MRARGSEIATLGPEFEGVQAPEDHERWQDSVVLCWWDLERDVGGYHRIGHQPGHPEGPEAQVSSAFFTGDLVLKRNELLPLRKEDRPASGGFGGGDGRIGFAYTDHAVWTFDEPEVSGQLSIADFHPPVDIYPKRDSFAERITSGHLEASGRITGDLTLDGRGYRVDGLAFRDHGWGVRYWEEILAHRWVCATFGPEATVLAVSVVSADGRINDFGCVIRDDEIAYAGDLDVVTFFERDGLTHRGGTVRMVLDDGEVIELEAEVLQKGAVSWMAGRSAINDTMCRVRWGDRVGICDFEVSNNAAAGSTLPVVALNGFVEDGLHRT